MGDDGYRRFLLFRGKQVKTEDGRVGTVTGYDLGPASAEYKVEFGDKVEWIKAGKLRRVENEQRPRRRRAARIQDLH